MQNSKTERESRSVMRTAGAEVEQLSRRSLLIGLAAGAALSVPLLSKPAEAAVSMLRNGVDPDLVEPDTIDVGRRGGRGRGGRGRGRGRGRGHSFRRGGGRRFHGRGRSFRGRGRRFHGRRWRGGRRWYGGWGVSRCYDPWYRRVYWWRCRGIWLY